MSLITRKTNASYSGFASREQELTYYQFVQKGIQLMGVEVAAEKNSIGAIKAMNGGDKAYINNSLDDLEKKASLS